MRIEAVEISKSKKETLKYILRKMPLMSRVSQFNTIVTDIHLEYIEFKVLNYEIVSKQKSNKLFRQQTKTHNVIMLVNTYNGYCESIDEIPNTIKKYVSKSYIKESKVIDEYIIQSVKNEIINFLQEKRDINSKEKINLQNINIKSVNSIYKPYWVGNFKDKSILLDA